MSADSKRGRSLSRTAPRSGGYDPSRTGRSNRPQKFPNGAGNGWFSWDVNLIFWET
jgi:hypothetical protein